MAEIMVSHARKLTIVAVKESLSNPVFEIASGEAGLNIGTM
jgi:hypothetical protein